MKKVMKNRVKLAVLTLLCAVSSLGAMQEGHLRLEDADSQEFYTRWLEQQEAIIWSGLQKIFGVDKQQCAALKDEHKVEYAQMVQDMIATSKIADPSQATTNLVADVLRDFNYNENVTVVPWDYPVSVGSADNTIYICEQRLPEAMPLAVKKFLIGYAVARIINKDHSTTFILEKLRLENNIPNSEELQAVLHDFEDYKTIRADIQSMMRGAEYVQGQNLYMNRQMQGAIAANALIENVDLARYNVGKQFLAVTEKDKN